MDADESKPEELVLIVDCLPDLICDVPIEAYFFVGAITSTVLGVDTILCVTGVESCVIFQPSFIKFHFLI
jgi:hypothetical protein